ncbi:hypothetical protein [Rubrolithibacter danxiaensis]|uniref:hypothetical protein n=1 Tax=Rubrolithibacter danxiaensis TaxID=3390805 RepID=UPI003BF842A9
MISLKKAAIYFVLYSVIASGTACKKSEDKKTGNTTQSGILYYSADDLTMYNFKTREEKVIFSGGDHYKLSADGQKFVWYKNNFSDGSTTVQIHSMQNPADFIPISIPAILESTPEFVNGEELLGALARSADEPDTRTDLILFNYHKEIIGRIPHVKDFAFTPDRKDLIVSAEAVNNTGAAIGYAPCFS